jgi:hypothetical protein
VLSLMCMGYEPAGPQTRPPQKAQRHRGAQWGAGPPHELLSGAWRRRAHALRGQMRPHGHRCFAPHHSRHLGAREGECVRLAQSPRFLVSPAASFRVTALLWQHLKPIMSIEEGWTVDLIRHYLAQTTGNVSDATVRRQLQAGGLGL